MSKEVEAISYGKVYIAGEYAVVNGGYAIIFPVTKKVITKLSKADNYYLYSHKYHKSFHLLNLEGNDNLYITKTIFLFNQYLKELNIKEEKFKIEIISELDSENNQKYGLGSSACVIVSLLKSLFSYYRIKYSNLIIYKFACIIQSMINQNTSFGDLACIAYGKKILYKKFDERLLSSFPKLTISEILEMNFLGLDIQEIDLDIKYLLIYTGKEANSYELVEKVLKIKNTYFFRSFVLQSDNLVNNIIKTKDIAYFSDLNNLLRELSRFSKVELYTLEMMKLEELIKDCGGVMKFSGAGGGDCVLGIFNNISELENARKRLTNLGYNIL